MNYVKNFLFPISPHTNIYSFKAPQSQIHSLTFFCFPFIIQNKDNRTFFHLSLTWSVRHRFVLHIIKQFIKSVLGTSMGSLPPLPSMITAHMIPVVMYRLFRYPQISSRWEFISSFMEVNIKYIPLGNLTHASVGLVIPQNMSSVHEIYYYLSKAAWLCLFLLNKLSTASENNGKNLLFSTWPGKKWKYKTL